jgi:anti-anti-sigma factor
VVVPITEELIRSEARDDADARARIALRASNALVVPLVVGDRVTGLLAFVNFGATRYYHDTELDLAAELGRRASMMLTADRRGTRERQLQQVSADLASAGSVLEAARLLVARLPDILGASAVSVYLAEPERGLRLVHAAGYAEPMLGRYSALRPDDPGPIAAAARTGEPVWIGNRDEWARDWPHLLESAVAADRHAAAALPLAAVGRVVGTIGLSFPTERTFPADERDFVLALVAQAAPAFERAAAADERRMIAETLQTSLLPHTLPRLDRLPLASRYLPGARGSQAGGDWYDVLPLDEGRVAIAVGDVVGQGARAAAIMGQLRSALSGYLLEGHDPVQALERLDRFAGRVPDATGSTVACLVLDPETGDLVWARAGHPPPLVAGPGGCRPLEDATGTVLGVRARPPFTAGAARITPGESIVLYTDGLVERRGELVDDGIARLAVTAARHHALDPAALTDALLAGALDGSSAKGSGAAGGGAGGHEPADDVALIVARLVPAPLRLVLPAEAKVLRELRAAVLAWAAATGIDDDDTYDLQLAVGEAAANAVEHAYRGRAPGTMSVELARDTDGAINARVRDEGSWRPIPDDKGYRGRGLELIRDVSSRMQLHHGPEGTEVRFTLPPSGAPQVPVDLAAHPVTPAPAGPAALRIRDDAGDGTAGRTVEILGELDLAGVRGVRDGLLACADAGGALTVDLHATTYLASAGVALLVESDRRVRSAGGRLRVLVARDDVVRRALALSGVDGLLEVLDADG